MPSIEPPMHSRDLGTPWDWEPQPNFKKFESDRKFDRDFFQQTDFSKNLQIDTQ